MLVQLTRAVCLAGEFDVDIRIGQLCNRQAAARFGFSVLTASRHLFPSIGFAGELERRANSGRVLYPFAVAGPGGVVVIHPNVSFLARFLCYPTALLLRHAPPYGSRRGE